MNIKSFSKMILEESGLRNINLLAQKYKKCVIYYHQDMDGVASGIAIREYLKSYGIQIVGAELYIIGIANKEVIRACQSYVGNKLDGKITGAGIRIVYITW